MDRPERRNEAMSFARIHQHLALPVKQGIDGPGNIKWIGEDQTIQSVIDSCDSPEEGHPFVVMLPPGVWNEQITGRDYVNLSGSGKDATIIDAISLEDFALSPGNKTTISNLSLKSKFTIKHLSDHDMSFYNCHLYGTWDIIQIGEVVDGTVNFFNCDLLIDYDGILMHGSGTINLFSTNIKAQTSRSCMFFSVTGNGTMNLLNCNGYKEDASSNQFTGLGTPGTGTLNAVGCSLKYENSGNGTSYGVNASAGTINLYGGVVDVGSAGTHADLKGSGSLLNVYGTKYNTKSGTINGDTKIPGNINVGGIAEHADNTAALAGGLVAGDFYRTGDASKIVH